MPERLSPFDRVLRRVALLADLVPLIVALPFAVPGIAWLVVATRAAALQPAVPVLLGLLAVGYAFRRVRFGYAFARNSGSPLYFELTLWPVLVWAATLLVGPPALWAVFVWPLAHVSLIAREERTGNSGRLAWLAALVQNAGALVLPALAGLWLRDWLAANTALPPAAGLFAATLVLALVPAVLLLGVQRYSSRAAAGSGTAGDVWGLSARAFVIGVLIYVPALLAQVDLVHLALFALGLWLVNFALADLRRALTVRSQQAERLTQLEQLASALLNAPLEFDEWQPLLAQYLPSLFAGNPLEIRLLPDRVIYANGGTWEEQKGDIVRALAETNAPFLLTPVQLTEPAQAQPINAIAYPLCDNTEDEDSVFGGLVLVPLHGGRDSAGWLPTVRVVADQIAAAVQHVQDYRQMLDYQAQLYQQELYAQAIAAEVQKQRAAYDQLAREMALARDIQLKLLPKFTPDLDGWDLSVTFEPAGEASGDFYDFIPLPDGKLGLLIADVAGKGMGSALYMALSKTLLRAFALEQGATPARVLARANERMVSDTQGDWMVTVFYGILDPQTGELHYANAGHHPPLLWSSTEVEAPELLLRTGMPMGIYTSAQWQEQRVMVQGCGTLVLYTDGITEAFNEESTVYGEARLIEVIDDNLGRPAGAIEARVIRAVEEFAGGAAQSDDMALIVIVRD